VVFSIPKTKKKTKGPSRGPNKKGRRRGGNGGLQWSGIFGTKGGIGWGGNAPVARGARVQSRVMSIRGGNGGGDNASLVVTGRDMVNVVTMTTAAVPGDLLLTVPINPSLLGAPRLATLAGMYERYDLIKMNFIFEGSCASTQNGMILGYIDYDINEVPAPTGGGVGQLQRGQAHKDAHATKLWESSLWAYSPDRRMTDLYTDPLGIEPRLYTPARFVLLVDNQATLTGTTVIGKIFVEYSLKFYYPKIQENVRALHNCLAAYSFIPNVSAQYPWQYFSGLTPVLDSNSTLSWSWKQDKYGTTDCESLWLPMGTWLVSFRESFATGGTQPQTNADLCATLVPLVSGTNTFVQLTTDGPNHVTYPGYFIHGFWAATGDAPDGYVSHTSIWRATSGAGMKLYRMPGPSPHTSPPSASHKSSVFISSMNDYITLGTDMYVEYAKMRAMNQRFLDKYPSFACAFPDHDSDAVLVSDEKLDLQDATPPSGARAAALPAYANATRKSPGMK